MPDPIIDPATGLPISPPPPPQFVPVEEFQALKSKLDSFERGFNANPAHTPPAPARPSGPTFDDQVSQIARDIDALDSQIDEATANQQPISKLLKQRSALEEKRTTLKIEREYINPIREVGFNTMGQLTSEMTRSRMPYYELVKEDFERDLAALSPEQRMNPEIRQKFYESAVGKNFEKVSTFEREKTLRAAATQTPPPSSGSRGRSANSDEIPKPREVLGDAAISALKSRGLTVDAYYKSLGETDWKTHYAKHKEYYAEQLGLGGEED